MASIETTTRPKDFLLCRPVFTVEEFAEFLSTERPRTADTRQSLLTHHLKSENIVRIKQGLYGTVPPGMDPHSAPVDMFLLAGKMSKDAVLAYHTALDFYGKAHSVWNQFLYLTRSPAQTRFSSQMEHIIATEAGVLRYWYQEEIERIIIELLGEDAQPHQMDSVKRMLKSESFQRPELVNRSGLLNVKNGVLDLNSGEFLEHSPDFLSTVQSDAIFDPKARWSLWKTVLDEVLPAEGQAVPAS